MSGILYGVGVGPGDPELMTVKAWRLISTVKTIAYISANGGESTARAIAAPFIPDDVTELAIDMPMRTERELAQAAYDKGAAQIGACLNAGRDVVMLCEGDPFFYGSFIYIFERLAPRHETVVVPGVTSLTASAAVVGMPLARRDGVVKVLPATLPQERLREELLTAQSVAIIKVGRHFSRIKAMLQSLDLLHHAVAVELATRPEQNIRAVSDIAETVLPYFATILINADQGTT